jgi:hypothetical protein
MNYVKIACTAVGLWIAYLGYNEGKPLPVPPEPAGPQKIEVVITTDVEGEIPPAPQDESVKAQALKLVPVLSGNRKDALYIARTFGQFAEIYAVTDRVPTLLDFQESYVDGWKILIHAHPLSKSYEGKIDAVANETLLTCLKLRLPDKVNPSGGMDDCDWTPEVSRACVEALQALSWAGYQAIAKNAATSQ